MERTPRTQALVGEAVPPRERGRLSRWNASSAAAACNDCTSGPIGAEIIDTIDLADRSFPPEQRLANLTPLPRQAFLLIVLEAFPKRTWRKFSNAISRPYAIWSANAVMSSPTRSRLMFSYEDEILIAMELEQLVQSLGHKLIGVARTHAEAVKLASVKQPGLILADIQLADGSSGLVLMSSYGHSRHQSSSLLLIRSVF